MSSAASSDSATATLKVLVYSDDRTVREQVRLALGHKIARDLPEIAISEFATADALLAALDTETFDVAVLDGEATPYGGFGIAHQIKDEIPAPPPSVVLVARPSDSWLAAWSNAEAISPYPVDPIRLPATVADVVRRAASGDVMPMQPEAFPAPGQSSRHGGDDDHERAKEMAR